MAIGCAVGILGLLWLVHRQSARLRTIATGDPLTGLVNHRGFHEQLAVALAAARRERVPTALVMLDLDDFKRINERDGHPAGDAVLEAVGGRLRRTIRSTDMAARIGGDEFALILRGTGAEDAGSIAERARSAIATIPVEGTELGCSAGIAAYPDDADHAAALCDLSEAALDWAKRAGKRRTHRYEAGTTPTRWSDRQRDEVEGLLALQEPITAVFQPIVALATGRVVGYESLARFPDAGARPPDTWFAQAHACGLGPELEAAAVRAALERQERPPEGTLALNLSPSALSAPVVQAALPTDLSDLVIEITEHEFVPDDDALAAAVSDLRCRGARIALDDAGAGHAGLKQLMLVRPDIVKLDRDLTHGIHADSARTALVESFVRFARDVGATVCAEGIERLDDLRVLADLDVEWGQGYALGRPAPPWEPVPVAAALACRLALADALRGASGRRQPTTSGDRRLVHVSSRLAGARSRQDLDDALVMVADEIGASEVALSRWWPENDVIETLAETGDAGGELRFGASDYPLTSGALNDGEAAQVFLSDPAGDHAEADLLLSLGQRSVLMVPVVSRGKSLGLLEAYSRHDRPWARAEIDRARVIASQLASVIHTVFREPSVQT